MKWSEICEDRTLADLPYKIELNRQGQIVMSPHKPLHSGLQAVILRQLIRLKPEGYALPEVAIDTPDGTKATDVAWVSPGVYDGERGKEYFERAPEICVEVLSPSYSIEEMERKKDLYIERGAIEVWICSESGHMRFYDATGRVERSKLCAEFPVQISDRFSG